MPAWLFVLGGIVLVVVALLAVDWFTAGRTKRTLVRAKDQSASNADVGYTVIQRERQGIDQTHLGP